MRAIIAALLVLALLIAPGCSKGPEADGEAGPSPFAPPDSTPTSSPFAPPSTTSPATTPPSPATTPPLPTFTPSGNKPPVVTGITLTPAGSTIAKNATVTLACVASDADGDSLTYKWAATGGSFDSMDAASAMWRAPELTGSFVVTVTVSDGKGLSLIHI